MNTFGGLALSIVPPPATFTLDEASPHPSKLPDGYLTVPGWYSRYEPDVFDMIEDPFHALSAEVEELLQFCDRRGHHWMKVDPSPLARRFGFDYSRAFPLHALMEFYGTRR